ncbi:MAG: 4-hydroxybenzoate octaprenyltransferase [Pseudomonadota bacterium]
MSARSPVTSSAGSASRAWLDQAWQYLRLMRIDKPIGIWLLLWPTLWALWIAADGEPTGRLFAIFVIGVVVTRSAGCVMNDLVDRRLDREVRRTRDRPLAAGQVGVAEALVLFVGLGCIAIALAMLLNPLSQVLAACATVLLVVYPFTKRFLSVPQLVLGVAFGIAVPMAFAATTGELPALAWLVFAIAVIWAVIYDTMYAMVDRDDDLEAGIRSSAILFGDADRFVIGGLQLCMMLGLIMLGSRASLGGWYFLSLIAVGSFMLYQQWLIRDRDRDGAFAAFRNNHFVGLAVFVGIAMHYQFAAG